MIGDQTACPCEADAPPPAPGPITGAEVIVRFVPLADQLTLNTQGEPVLAPVAFSKDELAGKNNKSGSVLRGGLTAGHEIARRARAKNKQPEWTQDPVLARADVGELRALRDSSGWRMVCINADPTTAQDDPLGPCPTHASVLRSHPPLSNQQRIEWLLLRTQVSTAFRLISHHSGHKVSVPPRTPIYRRRFFPEHRTRLAPRLRRRVCRG